ncbi:hypothetical protein [Acinetobacter pragensis]|uniref:hypothetical protein n=1 Tax=Acinetobacter pragensis TaxID=1806892 RepID=UPI00333E9587
MLIGLTRPVETRTVSVGGEGLPEVAQLVAEQTPEGWLPTVIPVEMSKHETTLRSVATIARRDQLEEIEGADLAAVQANVPEGYQLLSVRAI